MTEMKILKSIVGEGEVVETHASSVLITDEFVYKIKKPVYFGFLDFRTVKLRKTYCYLEKELNSRFCEGIYLAVLKLTKEKNGYTLSPAESTLPGLDYVLKMKRIPDNRFISEQIKEGKISPSDMEEIGFQVAEKLSLSGKAAEKIDEMDSFGVVAFNARENFQQLKEFSPELVDKRLDYIEEITEKFLISQKVLFDKRYKEGYVLDGHGDLRLEHIFFQDNGKIGLIDCTEFSERFRANDVMGESGFLSMELDYNGMFELSDAFIKGFIKKYSDDDSIKLLNFYKCYRAVVRAKVAMLTMKGIEKDNPVYSAKEKEFHRLVDMALIYSINMFDVRSLSFAGFIATGKSYHAQAIVKKYPIAYINTDETRKKLLGMGVTDNAVTTFDSGIYSPEISSKVYNTLGIIAKEKQKLGRLAIFDGTFVREENRADFEKGLGGKPVYVLFTASEEVIIKRLKEREGKVMVSDGRLHHLKDMKITGTFNPSLTIEGGDLNGNIAKIVELLKEA